MSKKFAEMGPNSFTPSSGSAPIVKCYHSHPALEIGEYKVYGGSCGNPVVKDADVYVGFDFSMEHDPKLYPWNKEVGVCFLIPDMGVPSDQAEFKKMVTWIVEQIKAGKKVHLGCIGGHGRTGMVLSAVYFEMTGEKDAITYVRAHYCQKAVESDTQIKFLNKLYGITKVEPSKKYAPEPKAKGGTTATQPWTETAPKWYGGMADAMFGGGKAKSKDAARVNSLVNPELIDVPSLPIAGSVWGDDYDYDDGGSEQGQSNHIDWYMKNR